MKNINITLNNILVTMTNTLTKSFENAMEGFEQIKKMSDEIREHYKKVGIKDDVGEMTISDVKIIYRNIKIDILLS